MGMNGGSRWLRCIECGREILTLRNESPIRGGPIKCRKCYGGQYYEGRGSRWTGVGAEGSVQGEAETAMASGSGPSSSGD